MGIKKDTYDWPGPVIKNKVNNEQELTGCSRPRKKEACSGGLENWDLAGLEEPPGSRGERSILWRGARLSQVGTRMPEVSWVYLVSS